MLLLNPFLTCSLLPGTQLASLPSGPRVNEFGLEESCDAFSARWCSGAGPAASAGGLCLCASPCNTVAFDTLLLRRLHVI